jgi:hypothetical protein
MSALKGRDCEVSSGTILARALAAVTLHKAKKDYVGYISKLFVLMCRLWGLLRLLTEHALTRVG